MVNGIILAVFRFYVKWYTINSNYDKLRMYKVFPKAKHNAKPKKKLKLSIELYSLNTKEVSLPKKEKQRNKTEMGWTENKKMSDLNPTMSVITLHRLSIPIKRQTVSLNLKKRNPAIYVYKSYTLYI